MKSILIIDDNKDFRDSVSDILLAQDFDVWEARCPDEAFKVLHKEKFDLIICDLHMPFTLGKEFMSFKYTEEVGLKTIKELNWALPGTPIIAVSATAPDALNQVTKELSEVRALSKPFRSGDLVNLIQESLNPQQGPLVH